MKARMSHDLKLHVMDASSSSSMPYGRMMVSCTIRGGRFKHRRRAMDDRSISNEDLRYTNILFIVSAMFLAIEPLYANHRQHIQV
jgi:hypothetical protein